MMNANENIDKIFRKAINCDACFEVNRGVDRSIIDIAQPRWIGSGYEEAFPRILILGINPGAGSDRADYEQADGRLVRLLKEYRDAHESPHFGST